MDALSPLRAIPPPLVAVLVTLAVAAFKVGTVFPFASCAGTVLGPRTIRAVVTDATHAFDSPAIYDVNHDEISRILSFTHTYSGQALSGEEVEARGVAERHGEETWLVVGTTRTAKGEWIRSRTLLEENPGRGELR